VHTHGGEFAPVSLEEVLDEVCEMLALTIEDNDGQVTHGPLPLVWADRGQMIRLLENLVVNALHYRGEEPPRIHVGAQPVDGHWQVSVADNGIGIEQAQRERVFALFKRLPTAAQQPGTGAGLAICRRIVKRHDGDIWVESEPGEGSTFHFTLPAVPDEARQ
jgi:signal transduction histidine kinase